MPTVLLTILAALTGAASAPPAGPNAAAPGPTATPVTACAEGPAYYAIELVTTRNVPGTGLGTGVAEVSSPESSPFPVALTAEGAYAYDVNISLERVKAPRAGLLVAWITTPEIDQVKRLGVLDEAFGVSGSVDWNKFLVVVTLEPGDDPEAGRWSGPVVFRGISRSGMMHTMIGHGALEQENCAAYGFAN